MPEETTGAFWDQTVYSPRDTSKNMAIPVKRDLSPLKYGTYSREQYAYFFIYRVLKDGRESLEFAQVPVNVADTTVVGGSKYDGQMRSSFHKALNKSDGMVFIDQSVTGMFEKRTYIGRRKDLRLFDPDEWC